MYILVCEEEPDGWSELAHYHVRDKTPLPLVGDTIHYERAGIEHDLRITRREWSFYDGDEASISLVGCTIVYPE